MEWNRFIASIVIVLTLLLSIRLAHSCPTCVGRITDRSAPFFSDDAYRFDADHDQRELDETDNGIQMDESGEGLVW